MPHRPAPLQFADDIVPKDRSPTHIAQLSSLVSLRGAEHLQYLHAGPSAQSSLAFVSPPSSHNSSPHPEHSPTGTDQRIICAKFRKSHRPGEGSGPWWRRGSRDRDRDAGGSEESRKNSGSGAEPTSAEEDCGIEEDRHDDSVVIVLKMLDDACKCLWIFISTFRSLTFISSRPL